MLFRSVVNDTAGHAAGDKVLQEVAAALTRCVRTEDVVARHGGEEFAILVRASSRDAVGVSAERVRSRIESLQVAFGDRTLRVTTSIGVAELGECSQDASVDELIGLADRRLYSAKSLGRNRVCVG